ncbi:MAG: D-alanyl-D-alanine carboxypeptidase/D-alanyl-D-alanine-endopeptidase [Cyanomargarita calcarea GSE-NOS-MK-12-04C]|uniref:D-alanyl-D-alanine carboxypeptidase/D-alanyl-D-alanine-endopeptidase n=1 Tax=Cyanomargarita calcarea GSE-NOS-MK-12-04C TaxID=2839659 RepID=A0A951UQT0_9CYAN|nr:D-alanyl-D-alanine carboxypeptidase/D-alanyl-D-alanine-endopeptidase [Cyanomargarita calcarea GSE-NOS-MK-12-04C]
MSKRIAVILLMFLGSQFGVTSQVAAQTTTTRKICPAQLSAIVNAVANRSVLSRARWGILIQAQSSGQTLYNRDAQKYFTPASVTKLLTTAAALQQLGANFRFRTSVYRDGDGVLRVVGRGDPSFNDAQLTALALQLKGKGINQIKQLIADDSYVQGDVVNPSWQWEDIQSDYGAPIGSFIVNQNVFNIKLVPQSVGKPVQISWTDANEARMWRILNLSTTAANDQNPTVGISRDLSGNVLRIQGELAANANPLAVALPVVDPNYFFLRRFRTALANQKISLADTSIGTGTSQQELAAVQSPPLSQLLAETNLESNNLYAESLLRVLAVKQARLPNQTTADVGLDVMRKTLTQLGVNPATYVTVDGSGLSRRNLISPEALVQTLRLIGKTPAASVFRTSLPVAGKSGTLKFRFQNTPAEGIVFAKTGTMGGVVALAGYVNAPKYEPVVFSIMVNQTEQSAKVVRQAMDEIVVNLAQLQRC